MELLLIREADEVAESQLPSTTRVGPLGPHEETSITHNPGLCNMARRPMQSLRVGMVTHMPVLILTLGR